MTHHIELVQRVDAPADTIWSVLTDIESAPETLSGVARVEVLTPGEYAAGFRWRETRKMMGKEGTEEMWVASVDAPRSTTLKAKSGGVAYTTRFTLLPIEQGTELRMSFGAELENPGVFTRLMMSVFGRLGLRVTRRAMAQDLKDIAARAESLR